MAISRLLVKLKKSVKFAAPAIALSSVVASTAKTVIAFTDKDDNRTTRKKITDGIVECGVDLVPAVVQIGLTVKNVAKANALSTVDSIGVDGGINTYKSIKKYKSKDPDEKITTFEAVTEVGQNLAISGISAFGAAGASSCAMSAASTALVAIIETGGLVALGVSALPYVAAGVAGSLAAYGIQKGVSYGFSKYKNWKMKRSLERLCEMYGLKLASSDEEVESFYRKKAIKVHPDKPGGSHEAFCKLQKDYEEIVRLRKNLGISELSVSSWKRFFEDLLFKWTEFSIFDSIKNYLYSSNKEKDLKPINIFPNHI